MSAVFTNQSASGILMQREDGLILDLMGTTAPADGAGGYAPGCIFRDTDTGTIYINETTSLTACDFNRMSTEAAQAFGDITATSVASSGAVSGTTGTFTGRMTTTDGVASGTVKTIGGLAYNAVADSTAITSTATETVFDSSYAIPANTLKAGTLVKVRWAGLVTAANGTDTGIFKLYLATNTTAGSVAGTAFTTTSTTDMTANDIVEGEAVITVRTAGSSGTLVACAHHTKVEAATNVATRVSVVTNSTAVNTQTAQTLCVSCTFNSTNSGNSAKLMIMAVEVI